MSTSYVTKTEFDAYKITIDNRLKALEQSQQPETVLLSDTFDTPYNLADLQTSPDGKWKMKYVTGGKVFSDGSVLTMYCKTVTNPAEQASTLLLSTKVFKDFKLDVDVRLNFQLLNPPASWNVPWVFWSFNDEMEGPAKVSNHYYYFILKTNGWEWGKKDNKAGDVTNEKQIFMKTGTTPVCQKGVFYHLTVIKKGFHATIKVNGTTIVDMDDPLVNDPTRMAQGFIGLYEEDANASFDNVKVVAVV